MRELLGWTSSSAALARELSLGQRMRADLALALLHEPEILFLDEPTLGLDVLAKRDDPGFIKELNRERSVTVMVTSHDMAELEQLAGRIVMIHQGKIAFDGDFDRLRREFADRRRLLLETQSDRPPPRLDGAELVESAAAGTSTSSTPRKSKIAALLEQAAAQTAGAGRRDPPRADRRRYRRHLRTVAALRDEAPVRGGNLAVRSTSKASSRVG